MIINKDYKYAEDLDILYINNNPSKEKISDTLVLGNIVIHIGAGGKVLGIEIDCPSKIFNFTPEEFSNLKIAKVQIIKIGELLTLGIILGTEIKQHTFQISMSQEKNLAIAC